jgi:UrcA family protein
MLMPYRLKYHDILSSSQYLQRYIPKLRWCYFPITGMLHCTNSERKIVMKNISIAIALAMTSVTAIASQSAKAQEAVTFKFNKIELESSDSRDQLLIRLKSVAKKACAKLNYSTYFTYYNCREDIESQLISKINSPALSALVNKRNVKIASIER